MHDAHRCIPYMFSLQAKQHTNTYPSFSGGCREGGWEKKNVVSFSLDRAIQEKLPHLGKIGSPEQDQSQWDKAGTGLEPQVQEFSTFFFFTGNCDFFFSSSFFFFPFLFSSLV